MKLLDRITEPDRPYVLWFVFMCLLICYTAGFVWDSSAFFGAWACLFLLMPQSDDYFKRRSERRLAEARRSMAEWEQAFRSRWQTSRVTSHISGLITPDWML